MGDSLSADDIERVRGWVRRHREVVITPAEARLVALAALLSPTGTRISVTGTDVASGQPVHTTMSGAVLLTVLGREPGR
jgi:hypothetical protein